MVDGHIKAGQNVVYVVNINIEVTFDKKGKAKANLGKAINIVRNLGRSILKNHVDNRTGILF